MEASQIHTELMLQKDQDPLNATAQDQDQRTQNIRYEHGFHQKPSLVRHLSFKGSEEGKSGTHQTKTVKVVATDTGN